MKILLCRPKALPPGKREHAQRRAVELNPENDLERRFVDLPGGVRRGEPRRIVVVKGRKWKPSGVDLTVSFLDGEKKDLRTKILLHMNAWGRDANVKFVETARQGQVRIARLKSPTTMAGYWSYIGTEILDAPEDEPTMNLEGFHIGTPESEFRRVVRHETGHTLGFEHEHMRSEIVKKIDPQKAYSFFKRDQDWSREDVDEQVLTPLASKSIMGTTEADPVSIMCYDLPASIMRDHKPIKGGDDINERDHAFAARLYPKRMRSTASIDSPTPEPDVNASKVSNAEVEHGPARSSDTISPRPAIPVGDAPDVFEIVVLDKFDPERKGPANTDGEKFARVIASYRGAKAEWPMRLRSDRGQKQTNFRDIITTHERIKKYTNREAGSLPDGEELLAFGAQLFDTLFQGNVRRLYDEARTWQRRRLDLVFTSMVPWIAEKPWEFAYDADRKSFLATQDVRFSRNVLTSIPADPFDEISGPLRILVVSAQPVGFGRLSIDQEKDAILNGFRPLIGAGLATVDALPRVTPSVLHGHLDNGNYHIVHFIGHGTFDEESQEGRLVFVNEQGEQYVLGPRSLREIFCCRGLKLVFLNACESGRGGRADFNKGVAQSLVANGLPALVANQYSVLDSSATYFAQHFYWALTQGATLGHAAREARIAVNYAVRGESIDWAIPVLYARNPDQRLCVPPATTQLRPATRIRPAARRSTRSHANRVAVWDMDNVFPALGTTLATMTAAQDRFGFELADFSVPLDVWSIDDDWKKTFLWAEKLVERMGAAAVEIGVDLLCCVTRQWMCDNDTVNIYGYTAADAEEPIAIFSVAGFDQLPPQGAETDRVIANAMVAALAESFGDADNHTRGSKHCPLFYNPRRSYAHLIERQAFDAKCRRELRKSMGPDFGPLEVLLDLFP
ncbi:MAG TPA: CHAT domain-containing protein [Steroidobacteraceae bacterium]|nr:CHAT domain-containing protein [Steroidobacteraceae bacterium]